MNRQLTFFIVLILVILGIIVAIDSATPKPVDWTPTYDVNDKIPLGLYVLDKEIEGAFPDNEVNKFNITPYEYFDALYDYEEKVYDAKGSFIFINGNAEAQLDYESEMELLYFAEHGNTVLLSMEELPGTLLDTLNVDMDFTYYAKDSIALYGADKKAEKFYFREGVSRGYFKSIDTLNTTVLGYQDAYGKEQTNFISVPFGQGKFLLHTQPSAFTNFHLLKDDHYKYALSILSYLPQDDVYWNMGSFYNDRISGSPLRYILSKESLHAAFWIAFWSLIIFIFFNAKRKQRIVPEIPPVRNTTVDFAKTVGNLYYQEKNHHTIIDKKIIYFLEKIRSAYLIDTSVLDDAFIEKLHHKTGKSKEDIERTVQLIKKHRHSFESSEADVIQINKAIEKLRL